MLINQSIHTLDLLCYLLGDPVQVSATTANHHLQGVIEVEDSAEAYITFAGDRRHYFTPPRPTAPMRRCMCRLCAKRAR